MTRTTPELAPPSPNFRATPTGGRLATTYDLACNRPHTRRIFSGIGFRTCDPSRCKQPPTCPDLPGVDLRAARYVPVPEHLHDLVVEERHEQEREEVEEEHDEQLVDLGVVVAPGVGAVGEVVRLHAEGGAALSVHDEGVRQHQDQGRHPDDDDGLLGSTGGALELERMADGVPTVDGDKGQSQHRNGHGDTLRKNRTALVRFITQKQK
ncbi:hypothetical protein AVEN_170406-1 [Araneus ventricosus]|uniref:Uncharacterized protein n=1 Tax=Araneus ventricosus TaxID=182803 RepID=A0A4Y2QEJ0_ARAVE|nr:hypothetical protein AVEN_170406-1 [Araneus ventricosus]